MEQHKSNYEQLGGWLRFFYLVNLFAPLIIVYGLLYPVLVNARFDNIEISWYQSLYDILSDVVIVVIAVIVAVLVKKRNRKCMIVFNIGRLLVICLIIARFVICATNLIDLISGLLTQALIIVSLTLYFTRSKRVSVYFASGS